MLLHKHHIIPKHAGGTDDVSNLVLLTVEEHADAHRILFEEYGRWQDEVAWKGLSGRITREEVQREAVRKANTGKKMSDETKEKIVVFPLKRLIKGWQIGLPFCKQGGKIRLIIPSSLAYSIRNLGIITPNSILVFDVEVVEIKRQQ